MCLSACVPEWKWTNLVNSIYGETVSQLYTCVCVLKYTEVKLCCVSMKGSEWTLSQTKIIGWQNIYSAHTHTPIYYTMQSQNVLASLPRNMFSVVDVVLDLLFWHRPVYEQSLNELGEPSLSDNNINSLSWVTSGANNTPCYMLI